MKILLFTVLTVVVNLSAIADTPSEQPLYTQKSHPDEYCLALNIYHESRSDNLAGQYAVADVVLNRVNDSRYPNTVCEVVYDGVVSDWGLEQDPPVKIMVRNKCQFSWFCDGKPDEPKSPDLWRTAQLVAYYILQFERMRGITEGATHYHATYVNPSWSKTLDPIGRIGEHLFFRWP